MIAQFLRHIKLLVERLHFRRVECEAGSVGGEGIVVVVDGLEPLGENHHAEAFEFQTLNAAHYDAVPIGGFHAVGASYVL